jgi:hypothetical protein
MIKILAVLLLAIAGFYLGYKLYKSNKEDDQTVSMYAALTMICAVTGGIVLISYLLLKGSPWTGENKVVMRYILILCIAVSFIYLGGKLIIRGRRGDNKLTQIAGLSWVLVALLASGYALSYVSKMNEGWTPERQKALMDKCVEQNASYGYDCPCFVQEVMKKYKTNEDYNAAMKGQVEDQFHEAMDTLCPCGVKAYSEEEVEAVDF